MTTSTAPRFHEYLDTRTSPLFEAMFDLPFVRDVGAGTLDEQRFAFFIAEDLLYLDEFARALAVGARLAPDPATRQMFLLHATSVLTVEQTLHEQVGSRLGLDPTVIRQQEPAPVTLAYTDHLMKVASTGRLVELVGAVLPCYWVYYRVGSHLAANLPDHDLYSTWIESYGLPAFGEAVAEQLALIDKLASEADQDTRDRTERWFSRSLRYEWMFWDQAYRQLRWPLS